MSERWPTFHEPSLKWLEGVEKRLRRLRHPEQGAFLALFNALEFQLEAGAVPEVVESLLQAIVAFARAVGVEPSSLGLHDDPGETFASMAPRVRRPTR